MRLDSTTGREFRHIQTDDDRCRLAEPPTRRRARDSQVRRHSHVPGALDEIPKPVVVALLRAGDGGHGNDHRRLRHTALNSSRTIGSLRRRDDNSRSKVQNVRRDSSAMLQLVVQVIAGVGNFSKAGL